MNKEQSDKIIKAQAKLLVHLTERIVMLQVAFEAFVREQQDDEELKEHYALRKTMLEDDLKGTTTVLLNTLKQAIDLPESLDRN